MHSDASAHSRRLAASGIQARLPVSVPDDACEREAELIAAEVTGLAAPTAVAPVVEAPPRLARLSAAPETGYVPPQTESAVTALPGHGTPLPTETRAFFEPRLGADLSRVRVHTGASAERAAEDVGALAFTVGSDIVFGRGQFAPGASSGRRLLAHELVHVLQQQPQPGYRHAGKSAQRTPYWMEFDLQGAPGGLTRPLTGDKVHNELLDKIGKTNDALFTEAPVPNASRLGVAFGSRGAADMYKGSTTVGLEFPQQQEPANLPSGRRLRRGGASYDHAGRSAPRVERGKIERVAQAPDQIGLGELKGGLQGLTPDQPGPQLDGYASGYRQVAKELAEYASAHPDKVQTGAAWSPQIGRLSKGDVRLPPDYEPGSASGQASRRLVLVHNSRTRTWSVHHRIMGKLYVVHNSALGPGVWSYFYAPDSGVSLGELPPSVRALGNQITTRLITPILNGPIMARLRSPARPVPRMPRVLAARPVRRMPRVLARKPDTFNYTAWKQAHDEVAQQAEQPKGSTAYQDVGVAEHVEEANAAPRRAGVNLPAQPAQALEGAKTVDRVDFWTGPKATVLALFRRAFGRVFVSAADLFFRVRDKLRDLLKGKPDRSRFGQGIPGAALRAAYMVLKSSARRVLSQTVDTLVDSLRRGTTNKLKTLIGVERLQELDDKIDRITSLRDQLESSVEQRIEDALGKDVVERLTSIFREVERIKEIVTDITQVVNLVKWAAEVIECVSPPVVGCLWALAQSALEWAASKVIETCWFQKKIQPLIGKLPFLRTLSGRIAGTIVEQLKRVLPDGVKDIFADMDTSTSALGDEALDCESEDGAAQISPEQEALLRLIQRVGQDRYKALLQAMIKSGVPQSHALTVAQINEAADTIVRSGVTAAQLTQFGSDAVPVTQDQLVPLKQFLDGLAASSASGGGSGAGAAPEAGPQKLDFTGVPVPGHEPPKLKFTVKHISGVDADAKLGADVKLVLELEIAGRKVTVRDIPARVISSERIPAKQPKWIRVGLRQTASVRFDMTEAARRHEVPYSALTLTQGELHKQFPIGETGGRMGAGTPATSGGDRGRAP